MIKTQGRPPNEYGVLVNAFRRPVIMQLREEYNTCTRCNIGTFAKHHVFGKGSVPADLLLLGEAPGKDEDACGQPFVGRSGGMLDAMLDYIDAHRPSTKKLKRFITNTIMCRPSPTSFGPNCQPTLQEQTNCLDSRLRLIDMVQPKAAILLGRVAADWWQATPSLHDIPSCPIYHPSYILRHGGINTAMFEQWCTTAHLFILEQNI